MKTYRVIPLMCGEFLNFEKSAFTFMRDCGQKIEAPIIAWLIQGEHDNILVDTGAGDPELVQKFHYPIRKPPEQELDKSLARHGVACDDIKHVILTHLHWDHCQNLNLFPNATFYVQRRELQYAVAPLSIHKKAYEVGFDDLKPEWLHLLHRIRVLDGDETIVAGVKALLHPGHTPGFQAVQVAGEQNPILIAGDNVPLVESLEALDEGALYNGIHVDLAEYSRTLRDVAAFGGTILCGHDYAVFEHSSYR